MGLKKFKPTSPGVRTMTVLTNDELTPKKPERALVEKKTNRAGRNNQGRITSWHRGGRHKRKYRTIDFRRTKVDIPARVAAIEYDPNRSARIALLHYVDGEKRYILAPDGLKVDDSIMSGANAEIRVGNTTNLSRIPLGTSVHNVEMRPGKGGQIARSAGAMVQLMAKEGKYAHLKMPSNEVRLVPIECMATIGQVGNIDHENLVLGKAGATRWRGRRPNVRGVAMNPVDHPMGGGEGRSSGGRHPCTPWGKPTKGLKTRRRKNKSDALIVKRRR